MKRKFKSRSGSSSLIQRLSNSRVSTTTTDKDEDGFTRLHPTEETKKTYEMIRRSKKSHSIESVPAQKDDEHEHNYDPKRVNDMLNRVIERIKDNKFGKALKERDNALLNELILEFDRLFTDGFETPHTEELLDCIEKLIIIGKSFFEYHSDELFITDKIYDSILSKWLSIRGKIEPTGIVPKGAGKIKISYPSLHNNMKKCYRVMKDDTIPDGQRTSCRLRFQSKLTVYPSTEPRAEGC